MAITNADGIVTPDEDNVLDPEVYLAAMADSISEGLGVRMAKQETRVSLRATAPDVFDVVSAGASTPYTLIPLTAGGPTGSRDPDPDFAPGNHADGLLIAGGVVEVVTAGMYNITGQVTLYPAAGMSPHSFDFYGVINGNTIFGLPAYGVTSALSFTSGYISDTRYLVAGDHVSLTIGVGTDHIGQFRVQDAMLAMSLVYAT